MADGRPLAVVTGATGGLGLETALGLAAAGHEVLLTGRDPARGAAALARVRAVGEARFAVLDVASLESVAAFAAAQDRAIAVLVNNAGVMALPKRGLTADGFEAQIGTNYLGHFALTLRLLPLLRGGRVVNVASLAHRRGAIAFDDLNSARRYGPWRAYEQSKLAMLMFGLELQRRSEAGGWGVTSIPAHPGWAASRLVANGAGRGRAGVVSALMQGGFNLLGQPTAAGALPLLYAALDPGAKGGRYYGPCCWGETRGRPSESRVMPQASDLVDGARLWALSEGLVGVQAPRVLT